MADLGPTKLPATEDVLLRDIRILIERVDAQQDRIGLMTERMHTMERVLRTYLHRTTSLQRALALWGSCAWDEGADGTTT